VKVKLTNAFLKSVEPPELGKITITDVERPGLQFRVTPGGARSWLFQKKIKGGRRLSVTLGRYPETSLAEARAEALKIELDARAGIDPLQREAQQRAAYLERQAQELTVGAALDLYIEQHVKRNLKHGQSRRERERQLLHYLGPLSETQLNELVRRDIQRIVDDKAAQGKKTMANRLRAAICAFTAWCFDRDLISSDPGAKVQKAGPEKPRTRTPSLQEVREIWLATYKMGQLWGPYLRLVVLLCQRSRDEVLKMQWSWINHEAQQLEIPDTKNSKMP
jgi:hypothetical protein